MHKIILLTGLQGVGKSRIQQEIHAHYGMQSVDLDEEMCRRFGYDDIRKLYRFLGESQFRIAEKECFLEIILKKPFLIALGGGTTLVCQALLDIEETVFYPIYLYESKENFVKRMSKIYFNRELSTLPGWLSYEIGEFQLTFEEALEKVWESRNMVYMQCAKVVMLSFEKRHHVWQVIHSALR